MKIGGCGEQGNYRRGISRELPEGWWCPLGQGTFCGWAALYFFEQRLSRVTGITFRDLAKYQEARLKLDETSFVTKRLGKSIVPHEVQSSPCIVGGTDRVNFCCFHVTATAFRV